MKRQLLCSILGLICLAMASIAEAQPGSAVPAEVCQAIDQYVAQIYTAGAGTDKAARQEQYSAALKPLTAVLKRRSMDHLLSQATEFAQYTELVASTDPTDAKFGELLEKRLKSGAALQEVCMPYTTKR
jgi:hypothetical protein